MKERNCRPSSPHRRRFCRGRSSAIYLSASLSPSRPLQSVAPLSHTGLNKNPQIFVPGVSLLRVAVEKPSVVFRACEGFSSLLVGRGLA